MIKQKYVRKEKLVEALHNRVRPLFEELADEVLASFDSEKRFKEALDKLESQRLEIEQLRKLLNARDRAAQKQQQ